ncbi:MAG: endonuclease domain-containing protein [Anaerolineaceae bacterium]
MAKTVLPKDILLYARKMRKDAPDAESYLWQLLRDRRFAGYKFRRQHPVGRYILDFYCEQAKLAIELDGGQHQAQIIYDEKRTAQLNQAGIRVIRFWDNEVLTLPEQVLEDILFNISEVPDQE